MSIYSKDYYKGIAKIYFNRILKKIIKIGDLRKEEGLILDFGCGFNHLKKNLKNKNVVGYDIIPELTDIRDYKILKPNVIVCNSVLEHLDEDKLRKTIKDFISMNKNARLVTAIPTENFISKIFIGVKANRPAMLIVEDLHVLPADMGVIADGL